MKAKNIIFIASCVLFLGLSIYIAFSHADSSSKSNNQNQQDNLLSFEINGEPLVIDYNTDYIWYDMTMMTTEFDTVISLPETKDYTFEVNFESVPEGQTTVNVKLNKLRKDDGIAIHIISKKTGDVHKYAIRSLHSNSPDFTVYNNHPDQGFYYFNSNNFIYKMNTNGEIVFYKASDKWLSDFKRTEIDGKTYYSYQEEFDTTSISSNLGYVPSRAIVMDDHYNIIDTVSYKLPSIEGESDNTVTLDSHEFLILGEKHYLIQSYVPTIVTNIPSSVLHAENGSKVLAAEIQEIKDGELIFSWKSSDHPELYGASSFCNDYFNRDYFYSDYVHLNSITVDPSDNNLILSMRNIDGLVKIDRNSGNILWILGGNNDMFDLTEEQKFNKQHFARITQNGTITIFDNGMLCEDGEVVEGMHQSYVKEFKLDEKNHKILEFHEYKISGRYSSIMGSAQRMYSDRNVFTIGWGGRNSHTALFSEEDFDTNTTLFEVTYPQTLSESFSVNSYRAYKDIA